ncbi:hypothetical protein LEP1GSC172_4434 [Leptospira noguchii]|uniref:Uncharacterized protein n=1 Tax=Leptospira noguchii TaxID=28182 RepID=M6VFJ8_9LEPT|nr:hypothetical protein LEP1GSC172_4434 [Leptospira noguchii]
MSFLLVFDYLLCGSPLAPKPSEQRLEIFKIFSNHLLPEIKL